MDIHFTLVVMILYLFILKKFIMLQQFLKIMGLGTKFCKQR